jgi:hypothetical protein
MIDFAQRTSGFSPGLHSPETSMVGAQTAMAKASGKMLTHHSNPGIVHWTSEQFAGRNFFSGGGCALCFYLTFAETGGDAAEGQY